MLEAANLCDSYHANKPTVSYFCIRVGMTLRHGKNSLGRRRAVGDLSAGHRPHSKRTWILTGRLHNLI